MGNHNVTVHDHVEYSSPAQGCLTRQPFYDLMSAYLLERGYTRPPNGDDRYWMHDTLGARRFEVCVIWELTREGHYGDKVSGWDQIQVPVPVR